MNELHRQAYLDAMGVASYFPRAMLPGALASPICLLPVVITPSVSTVQAEPSSAKAGSQGTPSAVKDVMASIGLIDTAAAKAVKPQLVSPVKSQGEQTVAAKQAVPQFSLLIVVASRFLLIAEAVSSQQEQDYQHMLANILRALGDQAQPQYLPFSWPMINSAAVDQSAAVARSALSAFLKEHSTTRLAIIFGAAAQHLNVGDIPAGQLHTIEPLACKGLITGCAAKAYAHPEYKRELWQHIAPLSLAK